MTVRGNNDDPAALTATSADEALGPAGAPATSERSGKLGCSAGPACPFRAAIASCEAMRVVPRRMPFPSRVFLAGRIWSRFVTSWIAAKRFPLPDLIGRFSAPPRRETVRIEPRRLGRIVVRVLRVGPWRPRCLFTAVVLYRLLREQGDTAEFVVGLPLEPHDKDAHAWVEVDGDDVGPPPGRMGLEQLARFP